MFALHLIRLHRLIERDTRTVVGLASTMLNRSALPEKLLAKTVNVSIHILNRLPTKSSPNKMPYELWFKADEPNVKDLRPFGQKAVVNRPLGFRNGIWDTTGDIIYLAEHTQLLNTYCFYSPVKDGIVVNFNATCLGNGIVESKKQSAHVLEQMFLLNGHNEVSLDLPQDH